jgi:tetratricopeptide (TPR) repeat protein
MPATPPCFIILLLLISLPGCGSQSAAPGQFSSAEAAFEKARVAFDQQDYGGAENAVNTALESGTLPPDLVESSLLLRARSLTQLGKLPEAEAELQQLQNNAANLDQVWLAVAELKMKQNIPMAARDAVQQARKINPRVTIPPGLPKP